MIWVTRNMPSAVNRQRNVGEFHIVWRTVTLCLLLRHVICDWSSLLCRWNNPECWLVVIVQCWDVSCDWSLLWRVLIGGEVSHVIGRCCGEWWLVVRCLMWLVVAVESADWWWGVSCDWSLLWRVLIGGEVSHVIGRCCGECWLVVRCRDVKFDLFKHSKFVWNYSNSIRSSNLGVVL